MKTLFVGLAWVVAAGGGALAADPVVYIPSETAAGHHLGYQPGTPNWTGWYVGGFLGAAGGDLTGEIVEPAFNGLDGGVHVIYHHQTPENWVISPFIAVPIPGKKQSDIMGVAEATIDWSVVGGVRLGYAFDRWLPYGFVGAMVGGVSTDGFGSNTHTGYTLGAGVDYALHDGWAIGARYAYVSVGAQTYSGFDVGWQGHSIAATISYKLH